jgi:NADPH:quinone reductase-like Zn-dependent oxidoreductase
VGRPSLDYLGVGVVGRVVAVGKEVGARKVGEAVGVYHENINRGGFKTGFATYLQVDAGQVVFLPPSIPLEQASSLLTDGILAFNALENFPQGSPVAVVGTGNLAYLTVQFAKRVFGLHVTVFSLGLTEGVAELLGADAVDVYSVANTKKYEQKFDVVVVTEPITEGEEKPLQDIAIRTGKLYFLTQFKYTPVINFFDLIVCKSDPMQASVSSLE